MMERWSDILWSSLRVAVVLGFSTALHRSKSMVTLDAVRWLVGEEDGGGNFLWWNPSDFFLFGGVEYRVIFKALKWTLGDLFFSEWKFVQYGCRVGYFARDSMKTEQSQPQQLLQNYVYIYIWYMYWSWNYRFLNKFFTKSIQTYAKHLLLTLDACSLLVI